MPRALCSFICLITTVLANVESDLGELKKEITHLKQTQALQELELNSRIRNMEQMMSLQDEKLQIQSTQLVKLQKQNEELKTRLNNEELTTRFINESLAMLTQSRHLRENSALDENRLPRLLEENFLNVAFYAYKSKDFTDIASHRTMIYDTVITNVGGGYNPNTGIFTPPSAGAYAFAWVIIVSGDAPVNNNYGEISIEIMQNGVSRGSIHADTEVLYDDDSATGFAILDLRSSDSVFLRSTYYSHNQGSFISNQEHARWSFSGFRIA